MARNDNIAGAKQVGDLQDFAIFASLIAQLFDLRQFETQHADHAAVDGVGRGLHGFAAGADDAQGGFEFHRAGEHQGGVFAQAQTGGVTALLDEFGLVFLERFERGEAGDENGRLAVLGGIELFGGAVGADFGQVVAEHLGGALEERLRGGPRGDEFARHAYRLGALAGK